MFPQINDPLTSVSFKSAVTKHVRTRRSVYLLLRAPAAQAPPEIKIQLRSSAIAGAAARRSGQPARLRALTPFPRNPPGPPTGRVVDTLCGSL